MERGATDWVRRSNRRRTNLTGSARRADGSVFRILVSNLSYEGCHLWSEAGLEKGELLELSLAGVSDMQAQVRWVTGDRAGVKFMTGDSVADERRARLGV